MVHLSLSISFGPKDIPRYTMDIAVWDNSVYLSLSLYISVYLGVTFNISRYTLHIDGTSQQIYSF